MTTQSETLFSLSNLYSAYRKAKVDVFYERSQPMSEVFCDYEKNLHKNLSDLKEVLEKQRPTWQKDGKFIGGHGFIPKGLTPPHDDEKSSGKPHFGLSDPLDEWKYLLTRLDGKKLRATFRPVAHFSVNMYVVCALWVNLIGHKYDACLNECARGSRLRRLRPQKSVIPSVGAFHENAAGSFQPYFHCYREWRERGLKAIRHELAAGRKVFAITMDLTSFYHNIDPRFILDDKFLDKVRFDDRNGASLSKEERAFTGNVIAAFETWSRSVPDKEEKEPTGVPVGPSAPRIIANVLLCQFDELVRQNLAPIYYGRYVDDIFLVIADTGRFKTAEGVIKHLSRRIRPLVLNKDGTELRLEFPYASESILLFKSEKQRVFVLGGEVGEDLLDVIESKIDEVSSEWRLLPNLDDLERSPAARVLTAAKKSSEDVDSLRKADELSLRRLGFALMLRSVDAIARDLPASEWSKERKRFYRFVCRHVITPLRIFDLSDYLPRLVGLAVACADWGDARRIVKQITEVLQEVRENSSVEPDVLESKQWQGYFLHLRVALLESVLAAFPLNATPDCSIAADKVIEQINALSPEFEDFLQSTCADRAISLFWSDLSRTPFKDILLDSIALPIATFSLDALQLPANMLARSEQIQAFLKETQINPPTLAPLLFPTRPLTVAEVTECVPKTVEELQLLREYVQALRGTWVGPLQQENPSRPSSEYLEIGIVDEE